MLATLRGSSQTKPFSESSKSGNKAGEPLSPPVRRGSNGNFISFLRDRRKISIARKGKESRIPNVSSPVKPKQRQSDSKTAADNGQNKNAKKSNLDCSKKVPLSSITFEMIQTVIDSWEKGVKPIPDWQSIGGEFFIRKSFELEPETITMFGFSPDTKYDDPELKKNKKFMRKAIRLIKAIDMAVSFLGPDLSHLEDVLYDLGRRHVALGCKPHHWAPIGEALFYTFEQCMQDAFTDEVREAWTAIYNFLGYHMIRGLTARYQELDTDPSKTIKIAERGQLEPEFPTVSVKTNVEPPAPTQNLDCDKKVPVSDITFKMVETVIHSWEGRIKRIPNWDTITGEQFLRSIFQHGGPQVIPMFGFPKDSKYDDPALSNDKRFVNKGVRLIRAIDMAVGFLGPDLSPLESELFDLGGRHVALGCHPSHWPIVGRALFDVFEKCMVGEGFTDDVREAWALIYNFLGYHMIQGLVSKCPELAKR